MADTLEKATYQWALKEPGEDESMRPHKRLLSAFDFDGIKWDALKPDPLLVLLNHSDCEGIIPSADCEALAARLTELIPLMPEGDGVGHVGNWRETTTQFRDGLLKAAAATEDVEFY